MRFQASLPEITQYQALHSGEAWALLKHSRRKKIFLNLLSSVFGSQLKFLETTYAENSLIMKAQREKHSKVKNDLSP